MVDKAVLFILYSMSLNSLSPLANIPKFIPQSRTSPTDFGVLRLYHLAIHYQHPIGQGTVLLTLRFGLGCSPWCLHQDLSSKQIDDLAGFASLAKIVVFFFLCKTANAGLHTWGHSFTFLVVCITVAMLVIAWVSRPQLRESRSRIVRVLRTLRLPWSARRGNLDQQPELSNSGVDDNNAVASNHVENSV